jgi:magnesium transporter
MLKKKSMMHSTMSSLLFHEDTRMSRFRNLPVNKQGFALLRLPKKIKLSVLGGLKNSEIEAILNYLDPDVATDLLQVLDNSRSSRIVSNLKSHLKKKVEYLLKFNPKTAAGMMSLDYIEVDKKCTFEKVARLIKKHELRTGRFPTILVVDYGFLLGELPGNILALKRKDSKITKFVKKTHFIKYDSDEAAVIALFKHNPHDKIVVLDDDESIMGVIYSDDILSVIENKAGKHLYSFAGVSEEEDVLDGAFSKVKHRYKWLLLNLCTAFFAASIVSMFQDTISKFVLLAVYMPIVAGMGGNAGTQTFAVVVRGIALREVDLKTSKNMLINEMLAGGMNGIINGVLVGIIATFWDQNPMLGAVLAVSLIINLVIAGFFGGIMPLIMKALGKDPATSATIFITTATDVLGFFVFLGLASILL